MNTSPSRLRAIALLATIFVVGGVAGAAVDRVWIRRAPEAFAGRRAEPRRPAGAGAENDADRIPLPLLTLQLSSEEERRLHEIARRWRPQARQTMVEMSANISDLENSMFAEMLCVLPKEKQERYLALLQENGADAIMIDKRFRLVRSNDCEAVKREHIR